MYVLSSFVERLGMFCCFSDRVSFRVVVFSVVRFVILEFFSLYKKFIGCSFLEFPLCGFSVGCSSLCSVSKFVGRVWSKS